ncbi:MAG TPA: glycoside hydrolase family 92 protein, partial [Actinopolymorphaceae bacterium]|nr:glycoside hydrolase family 92 protein [Actinopolymorphaceae bacterium]
MAPSTTCFHSSFEPADPQPLATPTGADLAPGEDGMRCVVDSGPTHSPTAKVDVGFTGLRALRYTGRHLGRGGAAFVRDLFEVDVEVTADTELSYAIFPAFTPGDLTYPATFAALDLRFDDGTHLSELDATDQHGARMSARGQGDSKTLSTDQWNHKSVRIGSVAV